MPLDRNAVRDRLQFYRELGIGPLYRRDAPSPLHESTAIVEAEVEAVESLALSSHVEANRDLYRAKFDLVDQIIGDRYGYRRPAGGFFLWLDVSAQGGSEAVTQRLWREAGVRVVPGRYLAQEQADGSNPGADYIRVAMVQNNEITAEAMHRLVAVLG